MTFDVAAEAYSRFIGRFSEPLADQFADFALHDDAGTALDVGCGPGALTGRLVERLEAESVAAVDPSPRFVAAARARFPGVDVREAAAEDLPFGDNSFDHALAQLVVHFMTDPVVGLREMRRVTRRGGGVAACVWDMAGGTSPLAAFWAAAHALDPSAPDESERPGTREGQLADLFAAAGLSEVESARLSVRVRFDTFTAWWEPFTFGVGPAGEYVAGLGEGQVAALRGRCEQALGPGPFEAGGAAWCARGRA